jgi:tetratricopeptide (TPR) repeat protein
MNVKELISDSHLAFLNQEDETALTLARQAVKLEPNNPDGHKCIADAYISLKDYEKAVQSYRIAAKYDPANGNRYFDLGYALVASEQIAEAVKTLAKAEELGCTPGNTAQLYDLLGIVCFDIGRYDDALVNMDKAEKIVGVDIDILQRKAIIYGLKDDIKNGLLTANQIKLIAPSDYRGYQIAFKFLLQNKRIETAQKELDRAKRYAAPVMDYYFDCVNLELAQYRQDHKQNHFDTALIHIDTALKTLKPSIKEVVECYINAAEIYLQLEKPEQVIHCLNAAQNPGESYNNGFGIIAFDFQPTELSEYDLDDMLVTEQEKIREKYDEYGYEEMHETIQIGEDGHVLFSTDIEENTQVQALPYKIGTHEKNELSPDKIDQINKLYLGAYTVQKDYDKVIKFSHNLQSSNNIQNIYIGKYTEVNAMKELGLESATKKYEEVIKYFRSAMIKDPTDIMAVTFRIQCYIDTGKYDEAEQVCKLLTKEIRNPLLEKIEEAKAGKGGETN